MHFGFKLGVTSIVNKLSRLNIKDLMQSNRYYFPSSYINIKAIKLENKSRISTHICVLVLEQQIQSSVKILS